MDWLPWSESLNKRVCRFIIHRYLGHLLKEKLDLEQLTVDLYDGTGVVRDLNVDTEYVNGCMERTTVPVRFVDGYIGQIDVHVPWKNLLAESCELIVDRAEVTVCPAPDSTGIVTPSADLMASVIDNMMASMTSSLDLAKNFLNDDSFGEISELTKAEEEPKDASSTAQQHSLADEGIEAFAAIIDAVLSRMRIQLTNIVVRLETTPSDAHVDSSTMHAVELRIDKLEFLDEQLEACLQTQQTAEAITTQPHSLYTIPDLNKLLHVQGVRLYTDVFQRPDQSICADFGEGSLSQICTSMYIRRNKLAKKNGSPSWDSSLTSSTGAEFQSCYSQLAASDASSPRTSAPTTNNPFDDAPITEPVLFAQFSSERQTIRIRLRNEFVSTSQTGKHAKVDMQMFLGSVCALCTPTQLTILSDVFSQLFTPLSSSSTCDHPSFASTSSKRHTQKPMQPADYERIETQLQQEIGSNDLFRPRTDFSSGNWSGEERFYDAHRDHRHQQQNRVLSQGPGGSGEEFTSIAMSQCADMDDEQPHNDNQRSAADADSVEVTHCKARLNSVLLTITYHDPEFYSSDAQTCSMAAWSAQYFEHVSQFNVGHQKNLVQFREQCDAAFDRDHLRLIASPFVLDLTTETAVAQTDNPAVQPTDSSALSHSSSATALASDAALLLLQMSCARCELLECLNVTTSVLPVPSPSGLLHVPLLEFGDSTANHSPLRAASSAESEWNEEPSVRVTVTNRDRPNHFTIRAELSACTGEIDLSLMDRLNDLLSPSAPSVGSSSGSKPTPDIDDSRMSVSLHLRDDLFAGIAPSRSQRANAEPRENSFELDLRCPIATVKMRIPVADLRDMTAVPARPPWWVRRVHNQTIRLRLQNVRVRMPTTTAAALATNARVRVTAQQCTGWFDGLHEPNEIADQPFLQAYAIGTNVCSFTIEWDNRDKSLTATQQQTATADALAGATSMMKSMWSSYIKPSTTRQQLSGPFSKKITVFEDEQITKVGDREEIAQFRSECLSNSDLNFVIDAPDVRLLLPDAEFYEVIYNRLVNDLALWEPFAPRCRRVPQRPGAAMRPGGGQSLLLDGEAAASDVFVDSSSRYFSIHIPHQHFVDDHEFGMCRSNVAHADSDSDSDATVGGGADRSGTSNSSSTFGMTSASSSQRGGSNKFCLLVTAPTCRALLGTKVAQGGVVSHLSNLGLIGAGAEVFVVTGWSQNHDVAFVHVLLEEFTVNQTVRSDSPTSGFYDVRTERFARCADSDALRLQPIEPNLQLRPRSPEHNLAVALRLQRNHDDSKDIVCAVSVRNTIAAVRPQDAAAELWLCQLVELFNAPDYPIAGYTMPRVITQLHVHVTNAHLVYDHCREIARLAPRAQCRLLVDSAYVCSRIVPSCAQLRLAVTIEDSRLFVCVLPAEFMNLQNADIRQVHFDDHPSSDTANPKKTPKLCRSDFVCAAHLGLLHVQVNVAEELLAGGKPVDHLSGARQLTVPLLEVTAKNDALKLWTCADTLATLLGIVQDIVNAEQAVAEQRRNNQNRNRTNSGETSDDDESMQHQDDEHEQTIDAQLQRQLQEMVQSAIREPATRRRPPSHQPTTLKQHVCDRLDSIGSGSSADSAGGGGSSEDASMALADAIACHVTTVMDADRASTTPTHHRQRSPPSLSSIDDDEFCVVDEIPGSGITLPSGEPRIRSLLGADEQVDIVSHYLPTTTKRINLLTSLPSDYPPPLFRYLLKDISVIWYLYGGSDFEAHFEPRAYSEHSTLHYDPLSRVPSGFDEYQRDDSAGGVCRDASVLIEFHVHKLCFVHELFAADAPAVSRQVLTLADAEVVNRVRVSKLNKCLYQYSSSAAPKRTCAPLLCWRMLETVPGEFKCKLSMLPLRLHMDQDTLEFLHDFFGLIGSRLPVDDPAVVGSSSSVAMQDPKLEVPVAAATETSRSPARSTSMTHSMMTNSGDTNCTATSPTPPPPAELMTDSALTVAGLFDEGNGCGVSLESTGSVRFSTTKAPSPSSSKSSDSPSAACSPRKQQQHQQVIVEDDETLESLESTVDKILQDAVGESMREDENTTEQPAVHRTHIRPNTQHLAYITSFEFSPSVTLRIDYQGASRLSLEQGTVQGLLIGLSQLNCTELTLKELHHRQGLLGAHRCVQFVMSEWLNDIRRNQLPRVVSSVGPLSSLAQIAVGIRDLFVLPVREYQREDGHVIKGVQRGAHSFGVASATAGIELTQRVVGFVQGLAEFAYDIVAPQQPFLSRRAVAHLQPTSEHATDLRAGLNLAYDTVRMGVVETADVLQQAAAEERASGRSAVRGLLRHATPTALRPIVLAGRATGHVLHGLRMQLQPETRRELDDKWRKHV